MKILVRVFVGLLCWGQVHSQLAIAAESDAVSSIASLIDPAKLATLRERGANPRIQKAVYWLQGARTKGERSRVRYWTLQSSKPDTRTHLL